MKMNWKTRFELVHMNVANAMEKKKQKEGKL